MGKEAVGIGEEEVTKILADGKILSPSIVKAVNKIIEINNERLIDYIMKRVKD